MKKYDLILPVLSGEITVDEYCQKNSLSRSTLYRYLKQFKEHQLTGLARRQRSDKGRCRVLTPKQIELLIKAKKENYKRSVEMLRWILENKGEKTKAHDSTIHRLLKANGLDRQWRRKKPKVLLPMDIIEPMKVWMGDFSPGPYLPHPQDETKKAETHLCLWHDAGGHMIMKGRYYWQANQFNGLLTLKNAMIRYGIPAKIYIDRGEMAGEEMKRIAAYFGITYIRGTPYHAEGRGHVERQFRSIQDSFESECLWSTKNGLDSALGSI